MSYSVVYGFTNVRRRNSQVVLNYFSAVYPQTEFYTEKLCRAFTKDHSLEEYLKVFHDRSNICVYFQFKYQGGFVRSEKQV